MGLPTKRTIFQEVEYDSLKMVTQVSLLVRNISTKPLTVLRASRAASLCDQPEAGQG